MSSGMHLYMMLLGCRPANRLTEQHDIFFGIGSSMKDLVPAIRNYWPEAKGNIHVDAWRKVSQVGSYKIEVIEKNQRELNQPHLFFINLGGYKKDEFDEFHYKMLIVSNNKSEAIFQSKQTAFYKHTGYMGAESHIDDKYGIDVDDIVEIKDILSENFKAYYQLKISGKEGMEDEIHLGYFKLDKF